MKNMAFTNVDNIIVALHTTEPPSEEEWAGYIKAVRKLDLGKIRAIAFTDGGAPTAKMRKELNEVLKGRPSISAAVTSSAMVRSVVTALAWFNPFLKAFAPERTDEAFAHLKLTTLESEAVRAQVRILHTQFSPPLRCVAL
jgi:hypothetical protein